jgi:hypothetical protein
MSVIGLNLGRDSMILYTGRDFKWTFQNLNEDGVTPEDFPDGDLYFELSVSTDSGVTPTTKWDFTITGDTASLKIDSELADLIPARTQWQLVFLVTGEAAGGDPVAYGTVRRVPAT